MLGAATIDSPVSRPNSALAADSAADSAEVTLAAPGAKKLKLASSSVPFSHLDSAITAARVSACTVSALHRPTHPPTAGYT